VIYIYIITKELCVKERNIIAPQNLQIK